MRKVKLSNILRLSREDQNHATEVIHGGADCLCEAIEPDRVPHFTTFQKAARRLLRSKPVDQLLDETVHRMMGHRRRVPLAA